MLRKTFECLKKSVLNLTMLYYCSSTPVSSTNENDQQSSSDTSIILEDKNVQAESEPAFDGVNPLAHIIDSTMNIHSKAGKLDDPVLLDLAVRLHARASAKLYAAQCQRPNDSTVRVH